MGEPHSPWPRFGFTGSRAAFYAFAGGEAGFWGLIKHSDHKYSGSKIKTYGGATYPTTAAISAGACPDVGADGMIARCAGVSTTGWTSMVPGEAVWMSGHIGIYIGDGLAVECTPKWENKVQITVVGNIGAKAGYNTRTWTKHGRIPWVDYSDHSSGPDTGRHAERGHSKGRPDF